MNNIQNDLNFTSLNLDREGIYGSSTLSARNFTCMCCGKKVHKNADDFVSRFHGHEVCSPKCEVTLEKGYIDYQTIIFMTENELINELALNVDNKYPRSETEKWTLKKLRKTLIKEYNLEKFSRIREED